MYSDVSWPQSIKWTIGLSADDYEESPRRNPSRFTVSKVIPKFGLQWQPTDDIRFRFAAFQSLKPALISNRTIEPTQIAGFNQFFDDANGTISWTYGAGLDARLTNNLYGGIEITRRDQDEPTGWRNKFQTMDRDEDRYSVYLFWTPGREWAVRSEVQLDVFDREDRARGPAQLETISLPVSLSYFHPSGFLAALGAAYVYQHAKERVVVPGVTSGEGDDGFMIVDASVGYRFPGQRGLFSLEITNLFDSDFSYRDDSFRQFQEQSTTISPFIPNTVVLARLAVNF